ncbi:MAG: aminoacyl-tRNA hydrolase [Anaerolineae bacterium]|nr:MAG: aminoacyl-tRNA hydrolase [Anaerolineae bacterium]
MNDTFLIAGLGNPGREYRLTRHNAGFLLLDRLATDLGVTFSRMQHKALITQARYAGKKLILAKPQTYMNLSGQSVGALMKFYKLPPEALLVAYDDVDLPFGVLRLRPKGGTGGHKGMKSIQERLGTQNFPRLRIGIGRPPGRMDAAAYVLQQFSAQEQEALPGIFDRGLEAIRILLDDGLDAAMNHINPAPAP